MLKLFLLVVKYLGYKITKDGLQRTSENVEAMQLHVFPAPNVSFITITANFSKSHSLVQPAAEGGRVKIG